MNKMEEETNTEIKNFITHIIEEILGKNSNMTSTDSTSEAFLSEDDLKFEFAKQLNSYKKVTNVIVEYPIKTSDLYNSKGKKGISYIDIYFKYNNEKECFIELKYKTSGCTVTRYGNEFDLKNQSAVNNGLYAIYKDLERMENVKTCSKINKNNENIKSFCLVITNNKSYWSSHTEGSNVANVSLENLQTTKNGKIEYNKRTLNIKPYKIEWKNWKKINDKEFKYLLIDLNEGK